MQLLGDHGVLRVLMRKVCGGITYLGLSLLPQSVAAQEYIVTQGPLSDQDFYNLVSCAAAPGEPCAMPRVAWAEQPVFVRFAPVPVTYPGALAAEFDRQLDRAISQINGAAPRLDLRRVSKGQPAHITLFLQPIRAGDQITGTGFAALDGVPIGAAQVQIWWDDNFHLTEAAVVFAADIPLEQAGPIMIEELTQAMGLMTDIRNPYYETRSVFSEDSNSVAKLGAQDRIALSLHYPARRVAGDDY